MNTRRMEHCKKKIRSFLMIIAPLLATTAIAETANFPIGALDSVEKHANFWEEVVGSEYELGACAFSLGAIAPTDSTYIIRAVDNRIEEPVLLRVGEFTLHRQDVVYTFEPVTHSYADDHLVNILINYMTLVRVEGIAEFDGGKNTHLSANLYISITENMTTGEITQDLQRAFVPQFVGKNGRSKRAVPLAGPGLVSSILQNDSVEGNDVEPCNRIWTWCRDDHGYCAAVSMCFRQWEEDIARARKAKSECEIAAEQVYIFCMNNIPFLDDCIVNGEVVPGFVCAAQHIACNAPWGVAQAVCEATNLGLMAAADYNFGRCQSDAEANNGGNYPGCDCPQGMVPFPSQRPPKWSDAPCQSYFDNLGIPGNWEELVF